MNGIVTATRPSACTCPVCRGLHLFEAPKYASGAVLTAEDLSSEQNYVRARMRLQNRHLHGWGVVCGLEVVCDDCEGSVRVMPGYAIDPCGNDLVLADGTRFDVVKAIRDCCDARRPKLGDCNPFVPPPDPGCRDVETHWCVTLRFKELESAQTVSLARQSMTGGCGCGGKGPCSCGGAGHGGCSCGGAAHGGCSCGGKSAGGAGVLASAPAAPLGYGLPGCAPRRLVECVEIGLMEHNGPCAPPLRRPDPGGSTREPLGPKPAPQSVIPPDSLLGRILACFKDAVDILGKRLSAIDRTALSAISPGPIPPTITRQQMHDALCRLRQALLDFLMRHDPVRCQVLRALADILVPTVDADETTSQYAGRAAPVLQNLQAIFLQSGLDCLCATLLPRCDEDPADARVPIACVTVRGDRIINICNHACRRYAGAFPSLFYWFSIVPIVPVLSQVIAAICCLPDAVSRNSPLVNNLWPILDQFDPTGAWRRAFSEEGFALPRALLSVASGISLEGLGNSYLPVPKNPVGTLAVLGHPQSEAFGYLSGKGLGVEPVQVLDPDADYIKVDTLAAAIVGQGQAVRLYVHAGKVVGLARGAAVPLEAMPFAAAEPSDLEALRAELADLRERVARLEPGARS